MNRREILFRGKRVDNGGWVEGNLTINEAGSEFDDFTSSAQEMEDEIEELIKKIEG